MQVVSQSRNNTSLAVLMGLCAVHALADIAVAVLRCHDLDPSTMDICAAALSRSQICLLAVWLVIGVERLSFRLCGLVTGTCFLFTVLSRLPFPRVEMLMYHGQWLEEEWIWYFRPTGPGDTLIQLPWLLLGIVIPLTLIRGTRAVMYYRHSGWPRFQVSDWVRFRISDLMLWAITASLVMVVVYQTAPYPKWYQDGYKAARLICEQHNQRLAYQIVASTANVVVALSATGLVVATMSFRNRIFLSAVGSLLALGIAIQVESWSKAMAKAATDSFGSLWFRTTSETVITAASIVLITSTLLVYNLYASRIASSNTTCRSGCA